MTTEQIEAFCLGLPGAAAEIKIEHHLTYNVGGKSFLWFGGSPEPPLTCSFKCGEEDFAVLSERAGFRPAPYLAHRRWIQCDDVAWLTRADLEQYVRGSYELIRSTLSKKKRESL